MKQRFSSLDIRVIAHELSQSLVTLRVSNIYDLSSRIVLFKFAKPEHREQVVVESGFRCHLTSYSRTTAGEPSAFVARLRKFLKTRRVTSVAQIGTDRILELQFSDGQYRLFLEFYAGGNIILTDRHLTILALLRTVADGAPHERIAHGSEYDISHRQNINGIPELTLERVKEGLQRWIDMHATAEAPVKKHKKKTGDELRKALSSYINEFPPILLDHAMHTVGLNTTQLPHEILKDDVQLQLVMEALEEADTLTRRVLESHHVKGYIFAKSDRSAESVAKDMVHSDDKHGLQYTDFHPFLPIQLVKDAATTTLEFSGFNKTVDEFFSSIEGQKLESRLRERELAAKRKLDHARQNQQERIGGLQAVQELNIRKAQAIEANLERVEEAITAINGLVAQGIDWIEIDRLIELEQARQNPVAQAIFLPLKLSENSATMILSELDLTNEEESETHDGDHTDEEPDLSDTDCQRQASEKANDVQLKIDIDLALSAWANAREYYDQKKTAAFKQEKTVQASVKALKSAQTKIEADLKRGLKQEKVALRPYRKQLWFEKFIYFISSDGYLVIGAKDSQQADLIYKKHLRKSDVYVHADLSGAAPVVVKNNPETPDAPIPPSTLSQAGNMTVATSSAWDSKAVMSAWWVPGDKVSKFDAGEVLAAGLMRIMAEKNYLPPAQLLLGFAVMFQISDASKAKHLKHRTLLRTDDTDADYRAGEGISRNRSFNEDAASSALEPPNTSTTNHHEDDNWDHHHYDEVDDEEHDSAQYHNPLQSSQMGQLLTLRELVAETATERGVDIAMSAESDSDEDESASGHDAAANPMLRVALVEGKSKGPAQVRGKHGKRKKIAQKYRDQDDDDREEALKILGSKAGQERAEEEARLKLATEKEAEQQKQKRTDQHQKAQKELLRKVDETQASINAGDEDPILAVDLDVLVGTPLPGDEILEAIPVCAPWACLHRYKYKVKLQPGTQKKGKAIREILGGWGAAASKQKNVDDKSDDVERMWPREIELIKAWKDTEVFNVLPVSRVRVVLSAASKTANGAAKGRGRGGKGSKKSS